MKIYITAVFVFIVCITSCRKDHETRDDYTIPPTISGKTYTTNEVSAFKELTVRGEYNNGLIHKLPKSTFIYVEDSSYPIINRELDTIISEINRLTDTNLVIRKTNIASQATITIYPTDRASFLQVEPGAASGFTNTSYEITGLTFNHWTEQTAITAESVFIDVQKTGADSLQQRYIMHHEMMHALGFFGHINMDQYSYSIMFHYALLPYVLRYESFDGKMIQLLYNPAIHNGMNEDEFNEVIVNL